MDFSSEYLVFIEAARLRNKSLDLPTCKGKFRHKFHHRGFEIHHIQPRTLGGANSDSNLVALLPEEHVVAHFLLCMATLQKRGKSTEYAFGASSLKTVLLYIPNLLDSLVVNFTWIRHIQRGVKVKEIFTGPIGDICKFFGVINDMDFGPADMVESNDRYLTLVAKAFNKMFSSKKKNTPFNGQKAIGRLQINEVNFS